MRSSTSSSPPLKIGGLYLKTRILRAVIALGVLIFGLYYLLPRNELKTSSQEIFNTNNDDLETISKEPPWLRILDSKQALLNSLHLDLDRLKNVTDGVIYNVSKAEVWRRPYALVDIAPVLLKTESNNNKTISPLSSSRSHSWYSIIASLGSSLPSSIFGSSSETISGIPTPNQRVSVYTFYDSEAQPQDGPIIDVWRKAMWAAGFEPVVLTIEDSKKHPKYKIFEEANKEDKNYLNKNMKWFAWAANGGGVFMDYRVIPVARGSITSETGLLSRIKFYSHQFLQHYDPMGLLVVTGGQSSERIVRAVLEHEKDESILQLFGKYKDDDERDTFGYYSNENVKTMTNGQDLSPLEISKLMTSHLHHAFLKQFQDSGLVVIDPLQDGAHSLTIPAEKLAYKLAQCPAGDVFFNVCPPTKRLVAEAELFVVKKVPFLDNSQGFCNNPCFANDSSTPVIPVKNLAYLPELNQNHFSIMGYPHPLTVLSVLERNASISADDSRARIQRNTVLRQLTSQYIPGYTVGMNHRLLLVKDAIYQVPAASNTIWFNWEDVYHTNADEVHKFLKTLEWEVGFAIDVADDLSTTSFSNTVTPVDSQAADDLTTILETAQKRALDKENKDRMAIEAWNLADTEIWKFLAAFTQVRLDSIQAIENQKYI